MNLLLNNIKKVLYYFITMPRFLYVENDNDAAESASVPAPIEGQNQNEPSSPIYSPAYTRLRFW